MLTLFYIILSSVRNLFGIPVSLSDSEEEETESSEEECDVLILSQKRKLAKPCRISNYLEETIPSLTAQQFQQHFRITVDAYENLLNMVGPNLSKRVLIGRSRVTVEKQLLAVLWLLATPDSYR